MPSFNLVCHGMMLFHEVGEECRILIPDIAQHEYRYGDPRLTGAKCVPPPDPLPPGNFVVTGIPLRTSPDSFLRHFHDYLLIRSSQVRVNPAAAPRSITVPRPDAVSLFRPVPLASPSAILGTTPATVAVRIPPRLHDVVVFSYDDLAPGTTIRIDAPNLKYSAVVGSTTINLCIYAQSGATAMDGVVDAAGAGLPPHPTAINDLLQQNSGNKTDFSLSRVGQADSAPVRPGLGLETCELLNLLELKAFLTDPTGCTGASVVPAP